jgi:DnaJ-class molecular chaperone
VPQFSFPELLLASVWTVGVGGRMQQRDPYEILGAAPAASTGDIQKAYRKLAKKLHPDPDPGNAEAEEKFKEIASAYGLVGDAETRKKFDRGVIDASGAERPPQHHYRDYASVVQPA